MKKALVLLSVFVGITALASNVEINDIAQKAQITTKCAQQVFNAAIHFCASDILQETNQALDCHYDQTATAKVGDVLIISFLGDHLRKYGYVVVLTSNVDTDNCGFEISRTR